MAYISFQPSAHFQVKTYSGNNTQTAITYDGNSNLQPDLIWAKSRSNTHYHDWRDTSRGLTKRLFSNDLGAEDTKSASYVSFDSNGFTLGDDGGGSPANTVNSSSNNYVSLGWKAGGGTTSSNTDGSITSTVQANTTAGFSIVTYTGSTDQIETVGHGLGVAPQVMIFKNRDQGTQGNWAVYMEILGNNKKFLLNTSAASANTGNFNSTTPTSSVFTINTASTEVGQSAQTVAYCFAEKKGFSKFGKYTGNGSADGPFVYTGFKPALVIIRPDAVFNWLMLDNKRDPINPRDSYLYPDLTNAEASDSSYYIDYLSNGFKFRGTQVNANQSGTVYYYMAFAEHPLVTSTGLPVTAE